MMFSYKDFSEQFLAHRIKAGDIYSLTTALGMAHAFSLLSDNSDDKRAAKHLVNDLTARISRMSL